MSELPERTVVTRQPNSGDPVGQVGDVLRIPETAGYRGTFIDEKGRVRQVAVSPKRKGKPRIIITF